ncbi:hypothetical protein PO909_002553 [Leuciscus waleckii]
MATDSAGSRHTVRLRSGGAESENARVCSDHFVKGCPGSLYDAESVDGAPTVNLSHQKEKPVTEASGIREERMKSWDDQHRHAGGAEALLDLHESAEDPDDTTEMSHDRQGEGPRGHHRDVT